MPGRATHGGLALLVAWGLCGCERPPPADSGAPDRASAATPARPLDGGTTRPATADPTGRDLEAMDEGMRLALGEVRNRFRCNRVSGCPAHATLLGFGWSARPYLEQIFAAAPARVPWRARLVRIVAELGDPDGAPFLRRALRDHSDEVRAYAIFGLLRLPTGTVDADEQAEMARFAHADGPFTTATSRLTARFMLHQRGEAAMGDAFVRELAIRARQAMAATSTSWGLHLCALPGAPDCTGVLPAAARHPAFITRRAAVELIERGPTRDHVPALLALLADPVPSLGRRAQAQLAQVAGRSDLNSPDQWTRWWQEQGLAPR